MEEKKSLTLLWPARLAKPAKLAKLAKLAKAAWLGRTGRPAAVLCTTSRTPRGPTSANGPTVEIRVRSRTWPGDIDTKENVATE